MSTTPPDEPRSTGVTVASNLDIARMPFPGNAEFALFLVIWLVLALLWWFTDDVGAGTFATLTVALAFGYLISRGIAKAGRVLEH